MLEWPKQLLVFGLASLLLAACGGGPNTTTKAEPEPEIVIPREDLYAEGTLPTNYEIVFSDLFENNNLATQGEKLWTYREGARLINGFTGNNRAKNVAVEDGVLKINFTRSDGQSYGGGIISNQNFGYGYYEAKIRFYTGTAGLHQSFWTYSTTEIDAVEMKSDDGKLSNNMHKWIPDDVSMHRHVPSSGKTKVPVGPGTFMTDWIKVGALYQEGKVTFYTDGKLDRTIDKTNFTSFPTFDSGKIWLTALPTAATEPMANARMEVAWVYYARSKTDTSKNLVSNKDFSIHAPSAITGTPHTSIQGWASGSQGAVVSNVADANYSRVHRNTVFESKGITPDVTQWLLEHRNKSLTQPKWNTNTFQYINHPANGKYYARVRYKSRSANPDGYASRLVIKDGTTEIINVELSDNTGGAWTDQSIGLNDNAIDIQTSPSRLTFIIWSDGNHLEDQLLVDFVGFYRKGD